MPIKVINKKKYIKNFIALKIISIINQLNNVFKVQVTILNLSSIEVFS